MTEADATYGLHSRTLRLLSFLVILALLAAVAFSAFGVSRLPGMSGTASGDFDAFYAVARLTLEGRLTEAYDLDAFRAAQADLGGTVHLMTWTYPPPFDLVLAPFGFLNAKLAYLAFTQLSFAFYLTALRKLAGNYFTLALLAAVPATLISLRTGQNGCLLAGMAALTCHYILFSRGTVAGTVLGLMVIKPHLGLGLGVWSLFALRWGVAATALIVAAAVFGASLRILGPEVWEAFVVAAREAGGLLSEGRYPHYRMASIYASLRSLGAGAVPAFAAQIASAVIGLAGTVIAAISLNARAGLIVALFLVPTVSPYMYDYDLVIYGPAFGLLLAELDRLGHRWKVLPAIALAWVAGGTGLVQNTRGAAEGVTAQSTFAGIAALLLGVYVFSVLWRMRRD